MYEYVMLSAGYLNSEPTHSASGIKGKFGFANKDHLVANEAGMMLPVPMENVILVSGDNSILYMSYFWTDTRYQYSDATN